MSEITKLNTAEVEEEKQVVSQEALEKVIALQKGYIDKHVDERLEEELYYELTNGYDYVDMGPAGIWAKYDAGGEDYVDGYGYTWAEAENLTEKYSGWRTPSYTDYSTLIDLCDSEWTDDYQGTGLRGIVFTLKSDPSKKLFFYSEGSSLGSRWTRDTIYTNQGCEFVFSNTGRLDWYNPASKSQNNRVRFILDTSKPRTPKYITRKEFEDIMLLLTSSKI